MLLVATADRMAQSPVKVVGSLRESMKGRLLSEEN